MALPKFRHPKRLVFLCIVGLLAAALSTAQSASWASMRSTPEAAVDLMPSNGPALERFAFAQLSKNTSDPNDLAAIGRAALLASPSARKALRSEVLLPKAFAILALAETDSDQQLKLLDAFVELDRRETALQGVILQSQVARKDYEETFTTVDRLLRVNPELSEQFFPILMTALQEEQGLDILGELARGDADWVMRFLRFAAQTEDVQPQLAELSRELNLDDKTFNGRLIEGLFGAGRYDEAYELHQTFLARQGQLEIQNVWEEGHPPFGWKLADERGFRAQLERGGNGISVSVSPGNSGLLASRVVRVPEGRSLVAVVEHSLSPVSQLENVRLQLRCGNAAEPFFDRALSNSERRFPVENRPDGCEYIRIRLQARVLTRQSSLLGVIERIDLVPTG